MEQPKDFEELHCNHWYCQYWEKATLDHFWFWDTSFLSLISISLPHKGMEETVFHSFQALFLDTAKVIHFLYDRSITSSNLEKICYICCFLTIVKGTTELIIYSSSIWTMIWNYGYIQAQLETQKTILMLEVHNNQQLEIMYHFLQLILFHSSVIILFHRSTYWICVPNLTVLHSLAWLADDPIAKRLPLSPPTVLFENKGVSILSDSAQYAVRVSRMTRGPFWMSQALSQSLFFIM